jgi:hypothetical protein
MNKSDEKLFKDIMKAVEDQERIDATVGRSVRELTEQGYKVVVEKSYSMGKTSENNKKFNVAVDKYFHWANPSVTVEHPSVEKRCVNCKFYTHYPHKSHGDIKTWAADGYCDNPYNSRKIIVIDQNKDFCKFFQPC